jgi:signal transduction histidine kinase
MLLDQVEHAERLASLGTLAAGVGHELKNVAVVLYSALSELREMSTAGTPEVEDLLAELTCVSQHVSTHASNLLTLGRPVRPGTAAANEADLRAVVQGAIRLMAHSGRTKFIEVGLDAPAGESFQVAASAMRVEQVLINLLGNAADALSDARTQEPSIRVMIRRSQDERVHCSVVDNGPGIPEGIAARIFEPYFTTKAEGKGTGLGLPVIQRIVQSYGSELTCDTRPGKGTTFCFDLPGIAPRTTLVLEPLL